MYTVEYRLNGSYDGVKRVSLPAKNKWDAYDKAVFDLIPAIEGTTPYSAWVFSRTYRNGREQIFNTFEGKPV